MTVPNNRPDPPTPRPLSNWAIVAGACVVLAVAAVVWFVLLRRYGGQGAQIQLDAIRTAGTLVIGTGGAMALLLTARRQRYTELTLVHTTRDATERRITELYTKAADQLGSEKAPVRLAGLHALERLAQNTPEQRQTIVDVICAYLRMPYTPPDDQSPSEDAPENAHQRYEQRRQELQVRLTAQRILAAHLRPGQPAAFWPKIDLDLTGAHLQQLDLTACHIGSARFDGATFAGDDWFVDTTFEGYTVFRGATFIGDALFLGASFTSASFERVTFAGDAVFRGVTFAGEVVFRGATFTRITVFAAVWFTKNAEFDGVRVAQSSLDVALDKLAKLGLDDELVKVAENTGLADEHGPPHSLDVVLPPGWITRAAQPEKGEEEGWLYVVRDEDSSQQSAEAERGKARISSETEVSSVQRGTHRP